MKRVKFLIELLCGTIVYPVNAVAEIPTDLAFTFIEPFPVGLLVTFISAAILRRK